MTGLSLYRVEQSNLPSSEKSAIRRIYEKAKSAGMLQRAGQTARHTGHAIRQGGESLVTGAALATAHVYLPGGLDAEVGKVRVPVDGIVAAAAMVAGMAMADEPVAEDLRNVSASALTVMSFRKTYAFLAKKTTPKGTFAGDYDYSGSIAGEDLVIAAARALG